MKQQLGSAVALMLAVVTGFAVVTLGSERGMFRDDPHGDDGNERSTSLVAPTSAPTLTPRVVEQTVYRDEYIEVAAPVPAAAPQSEQPQPIAQVTGSGDEAPREADETESDGDEGRKEDEDEHDDGDDD